MNDTRRQMNESDVREDVAMPLLRSLGYATGTVNDIIREKTLTYEKDFLGRKKPTDAPLRGRADYILTVLGAGSWTLEIKAEGIDIDIDAIEQAITYARHPQVSGSYAAILNGKRLVVFHNTQRSTDAPLIDLLVTNPTELAKQLENTLSPIAIRHDCSPPIVDLDMSLATGFRSSAQIKKGSVIYEDFSWQSNVTLPPDAVSQLNEACRRMSGMTVSATGGRIARDKQSRIRARLDWAFPNEDLRKFAQDKIGEMEYVSLSPTVSDDPASPTVFHVVGKVHIETGDSVFDIISWSTNVSNLDAVMVYAGQATGFLKDGLFQGIAEARYEMQFPLIPGLQIVYTGHGKFQFHVLR
jgi:hypothetical protein